MTVADIVELSTFGSEPRGYAVKDIGMLSPDGLLHAVVVKRGDLRENVNVFSLLLFRTDQLFSGPKPDTVLTLSSSSNRPAISSLKWLRNGQALAFLGERPGLLPQVYTLDLQTRELIQRTHQPSAIVSYDITASGDQIVYAAAPQPDTSRYGYMRAHGFVLSPTQFVGDVLQGEWADSSSEWFRDTHEQLFVWHDGVSAPANVPGPTYRSCDVRSASIAPNGRLAVILCIPKRIPGTWTSYADPYLAKLVAKGAVPPEFALFDLARQTVEPLVDAPALSATVRWAPTGGSILITNALLPLDSVDSGERAVRMARTSIAEVDVRTRHITTIAYRDSLAVTEWDAATNTVELAPSIYGKTIRDGPRVRYRKTAHGWKELHGHGSAKAPVPVLVVEEGPNLPPRLVAVDRDRKRRDVVLDPNPQLASLRLGLVEITRWRTRTGQSWVGGLYFPPDVVRGHRYPLVIQTHGFDSTTFQPDGVFSTANAGQPMAADDIIVLQLGPGDDADWIRDMMTAEEAPHAMEGIEAAIDHLDSLGLIDREHVGLIGFSRTCFHVLYTLIHSGYPIAAAAITDGVDLSYMQYMVFQNARLGAGYTIDEYTGPNGGPPFGKNLELWRERAPGFNLDRITAPLRLEAIGLASVLEEWEPYAGLLLQHKPVELFVIPQGTHILVKPWERLASSQANVDWFRFWLRGEEDPDLGKADQYARWRELRKLHQHQRTADTSATR